MNPKYKKIGSYIIKAIVAVVILYFVYSKIDLESIKKDISNVSIVSLLLGTLFFILSKTLSSIRLTFFIRSSGYSISQLENLQLYSLGMFYNLFLPGGVGGDAYKIHYLNKKANKKTKDTFWPFLLDRASGMLSLAILVIVFALFIDQEIIPHQTLFLIAALIIGIIASLLFVWMIKKQYFKAFINTLVLSFIAQFCQIGCVFFFLKDFNFITNHLEYYLLFLISSLVSIIPITPGGLGLRELTYQKGAILFCTSETIGVMIGTLFFVITLVISFAGIYFHFFGISKKDSPTNS